MLEERRGRLDQDQTRRYTFCATFGRLASWRVCGELVRGGRGTVKLPNPLVFFFFFFFPLAFVIRELQMSDDVEKSRSMERQNRLQQELNKKGG